MQCQQPAVVPSGLVSLIGNETFNITILAMLKVFFYSFFIDNSPNWVKYIRR